MKIVLTHPFCWPYVRRGSDVIWIMSPATWWPAAMK